MLGESAGRTDDNPSRPNARRRFTVEERAAAVPIRDTYDELDHEISLGFRVVCAIVTIIIVCLLCGFMLGLALAG